MSVVICPKCKSPNDDKLLDGGWLACAICSNRWYPSAATIDSLPTAELPRAQRVNAQPVTPSSEHLKRTTSGEYLPDEPQTGVAAKKALTGRVDGRQSGMVPTVQDPSGVPALPEPPSPGKQSPIRPAIPVGRTPVPPPPVSHNPETGRTIDSDLFDRLEEQAQYQRSQMKTVPEIAFEDPKYRTAVPHSDYSEKVVCPVCGHAFASSGNHHTCPQCGTTYDEDSQRIAAGTGAKDNLIGRTLRGCLIDRKLGEGGMGAVYHAQQLSLDRSVAVKVLPVDLARNKNFIQRFEREAKSLARINHPNILQIYDFGDDPQLGLYFMIIEFVEGLDLGEVLNRRGLLGQIEVLDLLRQAVAGLEAAAEKGVIHRDIKPDNLMIGANGLVKVSDFGLAKGYVAQVGVTAAGVRVGTPAFMSPEQCDGADVDFRSDVYNLGATAFLCLTGRLPFDGETPFAIMLKHKTEAVPSLCEIDPTIDRAVDRLIGRMLAKPPADRCDSLRQLYEDIEELESELAGTDSVLRKSRGPFRALLSGAPPMQPVPGRTSLQLTSSEELRLVDEVELVDLPPAPPPPPVVATPVGASRRTPSASLRRGLDVPAAYPSPQLELAPPSAERVAARTSRKLDVDLVQARERGRKTQLENVIANGDRLAEDGRFVEAAAEWLAAADLAGHDPKQQRSLRRRAARARRRHRVVSAVRRLIFIAALCVAGLAGLWLATPATHNWFADQQLKAIEDGLSSVTPRQQVSELRAFATANRAPWPWYIAAFGPLAKQYEVAAAARADAHAARLENQPLVTPTQPGQAAGLTPEIAAVISLSQDAAVPWETVALRAGELLAAARAQGRETPAFAQVIEVARSAEGQLAAQRADEERIAAARAAGDHAGALALAAEFRSRHVRALSALPRLPLAGRLRIEVSAVELPSDLALHVDGAKVPLAPAQSTSGGFPAAEAVFCRSAERETAIEVSADGFTAVQQTVPGSSSPAERTLTVGLRPAPTWSVAFANPGTTATLVGWAAARPLAGSILVQHHDGLLVLRAADGGVTARNERPTQASPGFTSLWLPLGAGRMIVGQDDGSVQLLGADSLISEQTLHRGKGEVLAWSDLDLMMQNGKRIHAAIERSGANAVLVAQDASREYWRYAKLKAASQAPVLVRHDDRLYLFDDAAIHLLEEDGTVIRVFALPSPRIAALAQVPSTVPGRREFLLPTAAGIQRLQLGTHQDPVRSVADPGFAQAGAGQVVVDGDAALVASDRQLTLVRLSAPTAVAWRQEHGRPLGTQPVLGPRHVVSVDDQGTISVRNRADGQLVQRLAHGVALAGTPLIVAVTSNAFLVVVCDRAGQVVAYRLRY